MLFDNIHNVDFYFVCNRGATFVARRAPIEGARPNLQTFLEELLFGVGFRQIFSVDLTF